MNPDVNLLSALSVRFGFSSFRGQQEQIVQAILERRDCFIVMPTGGGKSLCYQLPACLLPGACLVVSPLISLMKDQVDAACEKKLRAAYINSTQSPAAQAAVLARLRVGELDLLYVSPERLAMDDFWMTLKGVAISMFAIDEAHCMSEWGHDFRPDYLCLSRLVREFPQVPVTAFTATATERVQRHIIGKLSLRTPLEIRDSFNRPNLFYRTREKTDVLSQILAFTRQHAGQSGIIYRTTRKSVEETAAMLCEAGVQALPYHAGMDDDDRERNQNRFDRDDVRVMVATVAFGMGIDKPNIRYVIHGDLPKNMESYYQETGRAGRDGEPSECVLFYGRSDMARIRYFIDRMKDAGQRRQAEENLQSMATFATSRICRRRSLLAYFGESFPRESCGQCDVCASTSHAADRTLDAQMLLSAMVRTGEKFGSRHVVDIVVGADTRAVREAGHKDIKTYAVGKHKRRVHWEGLIKTLEGRQFVERKGGRISRLVLAPKGWEVLHGGASFYVFDRHHEPSNPAMHATLQQEMCTMRIGDSVMTTWSLHKQGLKLEAIALRRNLSSGTIACHLECLLLNGFPVQIDQCVDVCKRSRLESLGPRLLSQSLRELVQGAGGKVDYGDVRIMRAWKMSSCNDAEGDSYIKEAITAITEEDVVRDQTG